jgi:MFS family permease
MGWGVLIWSLATLLTPWAARQSLAALLAMRVVMGLAEGVAMPCMNNMIHKYAYFAFIFLCVSDVSCNKRVQAW